jgi:GrpB-like predicted nucleotidyltransferase (UPF0157 family)
MPGDDDAAMAERLQAITIGPVQRLDGPVRLDPPNPDWPRLFAREAARIRDVLRGRALVIEHVGSTSVPDLAAKPIIDMLLLVVDSTDETNYVPALEAAGYVLRHREPDWYQHRLFHGPDTAVNLHVFSEGCEEAERMLRFRDWLRRHPDDRALYEQTKRDLARRTWAFRQQYADAKSEVVQAILARALAPEQDRPDLRTPRSEQ